MATKEEVSALLDANPSILRLLVNSDDLAQARKSMYDYLMVCESDVLGSECKLHPLEKKNARDCINVFRSIIAESSERKAGYSCLNTLWRLATEHWRIDDWPEVSSGFIQEIIHLFKGVVGLSGIYSQSGICRREVPAFINMVGREAALARSELLDKTIDEYSRFIARNGYRTGLDMELVERRLANREKILSALGATQEDWDDYRWHYRMGLSDSKSIGEVIDLSEEEVQALDRAQTCRIPILVTPYYLSLMDKTGDSTDKALRTQVLPSRLYVDHMTSEPEKTAQDYMNEVDTSPVDLVTRRYAFIAIVKPVAWCPQLCIYCQRNWELSEESMRSETATDALPNAMSWFREHTGISEVLITGGDPLMLDDVYLDSIIKEFANMDNIRRIRIATRVFATAPMRIGPSFIDMLKRYHRPPSKILTIATHIQNSYEITPEMADGVQAIRKLGIDVLNQQVFTTQNCRKYETCFLRESLKAIGITPYYIFNMKGKAEVEELKVPIARLLQEQKEEARLMSGIVRSDKAVFNVPRLGKNELNSWQDHDIIMIHADGSRLYEFYPWEKYMAPVNTYLYKDVPIYDFLNALESMGEDRRDYKNIWYYF